MSYRLFAYLLFASVSGACAFAEQGGNKMNLEQSVCGLKEPLLFWLWSNQAGKPNAKRLLGLSNVVDIAYTTPDGRVLRGYKLAAYVDRHRSRTDRPNGYLLIIQGNAILADQILTEFRAFADSGYDVYIYDYRGYGRSDGKRRLKAIVNDYKAILAKLNSEYRQKLVYAMSLGGIVFLDGFESEFKLDRIIIDSSPSRLSNYGCPPNYDPVEHLPANCSNFMFIAGKRDRVVTPSMSQEMIEKAQQCGARILVNPDYAHPFMDLNWSVHQQRMRDIETFLLQDNKPN